MPSPTRTLGATIIRIAAAGALLPLLPLHSPAGPVPGVESFDKTAVDFETPESIVAWDIGNNEYLVTFRWKPDFPVPSPGVAGSFNGWSRSDLPFDPPDAEGWLTVTARIPEGEHTYKFISGSDGWHTDPLNSAEADGMGNSLLRLGIAARINQISAERGDGEITADAFLHDPTQHTYLDVVSTTEAVLRARTLLNDVEGVTLRLALPGGETRHVPMDFAASDGLFDFWEHHYHASEWPVAPESYTFVVRDGGAALDGLGEWPLALDPARIVRTPDWAKHAIWYQIMIDRWRDGDPSNNPDQMVEDPGRPDVTHPWTSEWYTEQPYEREGGQTFWRWSMYNRLYGGDFQGVIDKLDYLKDLGVTAIYFNPVFEANNAHKYNARSYVHADDGYGVAGSFRRSLETHDAHDPSTWEWNPSDQMALRMISEIHKRGMRVIFDGVWNHVGEDHHAFQDVRSNLAQSRYAEWFDIRSFEPFEYSGWGGFGGLPEFAKDAEGLRSKKLEQHIFDVTTRWMDPNGDGDPSDGIDGWRLDVPMHLPFPFWERWHDHVKSINPDAYIVGEVWDPAEDWLSGGRFDAVMNYQLPKAAFPFFANKTQKISAGEFDRRLARLRMRYPHNATYVLQNLFDSHDTDRWVSRVANPDLPYDAGNRLQDNGPNYFDGKPSAEAYERLRLMALFQATYVGAPMIYYGTEVGMFGADDPRNRMPMWWDDLMPYDNPDYVIDHDLREEFRALFNLRNSIEVLRTGDYSTALADDLKDVLAYYRHVPESSDVVLVVLNNSDESQRVAIADPPARILPRAFHDHVVVHGRDVRVLTPDRGAAILARK